MWTSGNSAPHNYRGIFQKYSLSVHSGFGDRIRRCCGGRRASRVAVREQRVHPVDGARVPRSDYAARVTLTGLPLARGALGTVRERLGPGCVAAAHRPAEGREHRVRRARVPRVRRAPGERVTLDDAQRHAEQLVSRPGRRGHRVTGPPQRRPGRVRLAAAHHHQLLRGTSVITILIAIAFLQSAYEQH